MHSLFGSRRLGWVVALLISGIAGCAGLGQPLQPPRVSLADVQVHEIKAFETVFHIDLRVFNTNDVALMVDGVECELALNGRHFATGVSDIPVEIPSYGTGTLGVRVYSSVLDMVAMVLDAARQGAAGKMPQTIRYQLRGHLRLGGELFGYPAIPFASDGELSLQGITDLTR
jgi:LEA14-like dessication related protein